MPPPIAIVCAMDWELHHARRMLAATVEDEPGVWRAELNAQPLVLHCCGMGMVNAAAGAQFVISRYAPRAMVNYGCAGAHRPELLPGDIVVGTRLVAYDNVHETPTGEIRYSGMHLLANGKQVRIDALPADELLLEAANTVAETEVESWPSDLGWPESVAHRDPRVAFGTVASADRWNRTVATIGALVERHDSLCEDMEAAAIGLVCASRGIPFLSIKDISNNELLRTTSSGQAMVDELGPEQLARRAAAFTLAVLRRYA